MKEKITEKISKTISKMLHKIEKKKLLDIRELYSGYGELEILKGVNIHINENEIVALIGPNGAGKSTVLKSIFNIAKIKKGDIKVKNKDLRKIKTYELIKEGVCYVNQGKIIFGDLSVRENLIVGLTQIPKTNKETIERRLKKVYQKFPVLKKRENSLAFGLSGGERQMLALGRALMMNPKILLLDEPSLGLSPKLQKELFSTIVSLRDDSRVSILMVEQNAKKAIEIADRTYLMEDGKIALEGGKSLLHNRKIKSVYLGGRY